MKTLRSHAPGGPESLTLDTIDDPAPGPGEVVVRVRACGINFLDTLIIRDLYQMKPPRPFAPGCEVAGTIAALGDGVSGWSVGDRVIAQPAYGGLAEAIAVPAGRLLALPEAISFARGAGLIIAHGTAIYALRDRAQARAGERLLVLGASGGTGLAAVELGKALGLAVIGAVSSENKAAAVRAAGASSTVTARARCRRPSRRRSAGMARTSSTTASAAISPSRRSARSPGADAI
jgi:NADPH:quinone reductase